MSSRQIIMEPGEARAKGFSPITTSYNAHEAELLHSVLADLADVKHVLVAAREGVEVWRVKSELKRNT